MATLDYLIGPPDIQASGVTAIRRRKLNLSGVTGYDDSARNKTVVNLQSVLCGNIVVDTTDFAGTLSASDNTAQKAFDTLDDISAANIPIVDSSGYTSVTEVESALAELLAYGRVSVDVLDVNAASFTEADTEQTITIVSPPTDSHIIGVAMYGYDPFYYVDALRDITVDIGSILDPDGIIDGADLHTAAVDGCPASMPLGLRPCRTAERVVATFHCSGNLNLTTSGTVSIAVLYTTEA